MYLRVVGERRESEKKIDWWIGGLAWEEMKREVMSLLEKKDQWKVGWRKRMDMIGRRERLVCVEEKEVGVWDRGNM